MGGPWPSGHNVTDDEARITDDLEKGKEIIVKVISEFIGGLFTCLHSTQEPFNLTCNLSLI